MFRAILTFGASLFLATRGYAVDFGPVDQALRDRQGLVIEIHGADAEHGLFAATIRNPNDPMDFAFVPLVPADEVARAGLASAHRHDLVRLHGSVATDVNAPVPHIAVTQAVILEVYDPGFGNLPPYDHQARLPEDLVAANEAVFKVHGILDNGATLMVEYKDANVPVIVRDPAFTRGLFRGDIVKLRYKVARRPRIPTHVFLKSDPNAVQVLMPVAQQNGQAVELCGPLVLYPLSRDIPFNIFALKHDLGNGYFWTYTLLHPTDRNLFAALRAKMQAAWDARSDSAIRGRNFFENPRVEVCAKGIANVVSAIQANPQIFIERLDDLTAIRK